MEEKEIENRLIKQLNIKDQWEYRPDLNTVEKLWSNLRNILNQNNKAELNGVEISDKEFEQIRNQLTFSTSFDAAKYLVGQNGIAHVSFKRDGKDVILNLFYRNQRFGSNVYQVVNQVIIPKSIGMERERRFDVTLLINGLPLIQIELKQHGKSENEAYEQIKKYTKEGCYNGIFRFIQLFVVSNGAVTKYFASGSFKDISSAHLSSWRDENNDIVTNLDSFTNLVLKRPMAYDMITKYTVLEEDKNNGNKRIISLRPYQIHAIQAIEEASKQSKSGYIWHTTGSGKTLTSYKTTRNLVNDIPSVKKTIFLVDRKDLDNQTATAFLAYSENDMVDVDKTKSTRELKAKLYSDDEQVIVTTIQKLNILIEKLKEEDKQGNPKFYKAIKSKRIAFVVDECHRTIPPERMVEVRKFFQDSLWYGFTGTPRFKENPYPNNGYAMTTDELYGKLNDSKHKDCCLHKYTIQNAMKDGAVLGFNVTYMSPNEDEDDQEHWLSETHMLQVIKVIIQASNIYGLKNRKGNTFESLLTVPNIKIAQKYYELFKRVVNGEFKKGDIVDRTIHEVLPDFPKFAISYSVQDDNENTDKLYYNKAKMQESIDDYNKMFNTKFSVEEIDAYNLDLQNRIKRTGKKYESRSQQLDLVIVVDRLLTGFDAIPLANLFIDRQPSQLHTIIQMFSRTNRIWPKMNKLHGNIVTFQSANLWKEKVKEAISLFTNGGEREAMARPYEEVKQEYLEKYEYLSSFANQYPNLDDVETLDIDKQKEFTKNVQSYNKLLKEIKSYMEYRGLSLSDAKIEAVNSESSGELIEQGSDSIPDIPKEVLEQMYGHYNSILTKLKKEANNKELEIDDDFDPYYSLDVYAKEEINLEYIARLIDNYRDSQDNKLKDDIVKYIARVQEYNPKLSAILTEYFEKIKANPKAYEERDSINVIDEMKNNIIKDKCKELADQHNLDFENLYFAASKYNHKVETPDEIDEINTIVNKNAVFEGEKLPFKIQKKVKEKIKEVFDSEILPLNRAE